MSEAHWQIVRLSLGVGLAATALAVPVAALAAYWMVRVRPRAAALLEALFLLPLVLPPVLTGLVLLKLLGRKGLLGGMLSSLGLDVSFTWRGAVIAAAVMAFPLAYQASKVAFDGVDARLVGVARTLGASRADAFFSVTLPLARTGLLAACVLAFVRSVGEFGATMVLAGNVLGSTRTLPLAIYSETQRVDGDPWPLAAVCVVLAVGALLAAQLVAKRGVAGSGVSEGVGS